MSQFLTNLKSWAASPLNNGISAWSWFLFIGLLLLIFAAWAQIFGYVKKEA